MMTDLDVEKGQRYLRIWQSLTSLPMVSHHVDFASAIEAEARKQDTEVIRQVLETLLETSPHLSAAHEWKSSEWVKKRSAAITAARARLQT